MQVNGQQSLISPTVDVTTDQEPPKKCEGLRRQACICTSPCNNNPKSFCVWASGKFPDNPDKVTNKCICIEPKPRRIPQPGPMVTAAVGYVY